MKNKPNIVLRTFFVTSFVATLIFCQTISAQANNQEVIHIPDGEPYPFFQQSSYFDSKGSSPKAAIFNTDIKSMQRFLTETFNQWKLAYQTPPSTTNTIDTNWFLWHYDEDTKKSQSKPENSFFSLNTRDKYRFEISLSKTENQQTKLVLSQVWREQEKDITPDSAMVWLKWKPVEPNTHAVKDFIEKIQTEFEKYGINAAHQNISAPTKITAAVSVPVIAASLPQSTKVTEQPALLNNVIELNVPVQTAWLNLIEKLDEKDITLSSVDTKHHRIRTEPLDLSYNSDAKSVTINSAKKNKHQFKLLVLPGATPNTATIVAYDVSQNNKTSNHEIASAFLNYLDIH